MPEGSLLSPEPHVCWTQAGCAHHWNRPHRLHTKAQQKASVPLWACHVFQDTLVTRCCFQGHYWVTSEMKRNLLWVPDLQLPLSTGLLLCWPALSDYAAGGAACRITWWVFTCSIGFLFLQDRSTRSYFWSTESPEHWENRPLQEAFVHSKLDSAAIPRAAFFLVGVGGELLYFNRNLKEDTQTIKKVFFFFL